MRRVHAVGWGEGSLRHRKKHGASKVQYADWGHQQCNLVGGCDNAEGKLLLLLGFKGK